MIVACGGTVKIPKMRKTVISPDITSVLMTNEFVISSCLLRLKDSSSACYAATVILLVLVFSMPL